MFYALALKKAEQAAWRDELRAKSLIRCPGALNTPPPQQAGAPAWCPVGTSLRQRMSALPRLAIDHEFFTLPERSFERSEARGSTGAGLPTAGEIGLTFAEYSAKISM